MANDARRPTPADPMPHLTRRSDIPSETVRNLPPELGPDAVGVLDRRTFLFSNATGDVPVGSIGGLVPLSQLQRVPRPVAQKGTGPARSA
ncbi:hypothetical protein [Micromonospora sp. WMMD710]|uniref:hypothetical protein n=1 Tax=Micromonospora sp. WMMD710 TaxID=3016085 RepID=UPI002417EE98|nr:hypothetical protein [Micromonospora sp. WMMD710]MDG4759097.1 hypothetical protein [Micromonospora sp. WMMD710]